MSDSHDRQPESGGDFPSPDEVMAALRKLGIVFISKVMWAILDVVARVARTDAAVLILGETGTGKNLWAELIQVLSPRSEGPFVEVNCAGIPEALLESELFGSVPGAFYGARFRKGKLLAANRGTLFLDEIGDMSPALQAKLLQAIEKKRFSQLGCDDTVQSDFRLIAATNKNLLAEMEAARFRADLYERLNVVTLDMRPLREHREDIPALVQTFVAKHCAKYRRAVKTVSPEAMRILCDSDYPRNIRELEHVIERAVLMEVSDTIRPSSLKFNDVGVSSVEAALLYVLRKKYPKAKWCLEFIYLLTQYIEAGGNASKASKESEAPRKLFSRIRKLLSKLGIHIEAGQHIDWLDLLRRLDEMPMPDEENDDGHDDDVS